LYHASEIEEEGKTMKKTLVVVAGVVVLAGAAALLYHFQQDPTGSARGSSVKRAAAQKALQQELWSQLSTYEGEYLGAYADQFQQRPDDPMELLTAFNELAYNVTGYGGLWRKTVPDKYFGCAANEHLPVCRKFKQVQADFTEWDKLQEQIMDIETERQARKFLMKNGGKLQAYIETFAPRDESFTAVQSTPFFQENLSAALDQ